MTPREIIHRAAFRRRLLWLAIEADIEPLEVWTAVNAILWGLWVANPFSGMFATAPGFATMALLPEWLWGTSMLSAGLIQLYGRVIRHAGFRRAGARTLACLWMFAAGALAWQNWRWTSSVTYPMLALASLLVSYRAHTYAHSTPWADAGSPSPTEGLHGRRC